MPRSADRDRPNSKTRFWLHRLSTQKGIPSEFSGTLFLSSLTHSRPITISLPHSSLSCLTFTFGEHTRISKMSSTHYVMRSVQSRSMDHDSLPPGYTSRSQYIYCHSPRLPVTPVRLPASPPTTSERLPVTPMFPVNPAFSLTINPPTRRLGHLSEPHPEIVNGA